VLSITYVPKGHTIDATTYVNQLCKLKGHLDSTRGQQIKIVFLHDNARPHTAKITKAELEKYNWQVIPHAPYSPHLAPSDYWLFSNLQRFLDGKTFDDEDDLRKDLTDFFASQPATFWKDGIDKLPERWAQVVDGHGAYL
jgi:histone-lysine N-methyltransferase SETMAR